VAAVLAAALLWLGVPSLLAELRLLPGRAGYEALRRGERLRPEAVARVLDSREAALRAAERPAARKELGQAHLALGREGGAAAWHDALATEHLRAGLARAPADPDAWSRLAYLRAAAGEPRAAAEALDLSLRTGPYEPGLALDRAAVGLALWDAAGPAARGRIGREFRHALALEPEAFARLALAAGRAGAVREALAGEDGGLLARFEALLPGGGGAPGP
jgi:hypothetical protein